MRTSPPPAPERAAWARARWSARRAALVTLALALTACPTDDEPDVVLPEGVTDVGAWPMDCALGPPPFRPDAPTARGATNPREWLVGGWHTTDGGNTWFDAFELEIFRGEPLRTTLDDGTPVWRGPLLEPARYRVDGERIWWFTADGVLRWSEDGGRTFTPLLPPVETHYAAAPALSDPTWDVRGDRILLWSRDGDDLLYTQDRGAHWRRLPMADSPAIPMVVKQAALGPDGRIAVYKGATPSDHEVVLSDDHGDTFRPAFAEPLSAPVRMYRDRADALWVLHWGDLAQGGQVLLRSADWSAAWEGGSLAVPGPLAVANPFIAWEAVPAEVDGLHVRARMNTEEAARLGALPPWGGHLACTVRADGAANLPELPQGRRAPVTGAAVVVGRYHEQQNGLRSGVRPGELWWTDSYAIYQDAGEFFQHPTGYGPIMHITYQPGQEDTYVLVNPTELRWGAFEQGPRALQVSPSGALVEERQIGSFLGEDGERFREFAVMLQPTRVPSGPEGSWPLMWLESGLYPVITGPSWGGLLDGHPGPLAVHPHTGEVLYEQAGRYHRTSTTEPPCVGEVNTPWCHPGPPEPQSAMMIGEDEAIYAWSGARIWRRPLAETGPTWTLVVDGLWAPAALMVEVVAPGHQRLWIADHGSLIAADLSGALPVTRSWFEVAP